MKKYLFLTAICSLIVLSACRKDTTAIDGPSIEESLSSFRVLSPFKATKDSVAFANAETVSFSAKFNKVVNWTITVTGQTSKAKKIITGQGKTIDITNSVWNGSTTVFPLFKAEKCTAKLKIEAVQDSFQVPVKIKSIKQNAGLVLADFENGFNSQWTKFVQTGANMDFAIKNDALTPQGAKYLRMAGTVNWDWLIGLIDFNARAYGTAKTLALSTNPDEVYFNCLIYGEPNTNDSKVLFQFKEDENADGLINANTDDEYDYEITVNWEGWKLITVKYADIVTLVNGQPATPKGNSLHNPDKIGKVSMLHLANPANGFAACKIDYIIFTNAPLQP
ncbi:MAG: hypothetical protein RI894_1271 [Bacteroidota bacterium]